MPDPPHEPNHERANGTAQPDDARPADESERRLRQRLEGLVPDLLRRAFYAGLGAVFTSEEGIRKLASDFSLPKDVATYLIAQAQGSKDELFRIVGKELRRFLENLNLNEELQRLLTSLSFEVRTEIRFIPNEAKTPRPKVSNTVRVRRGRRKEKDSEAEPDPPPNGNGDT